MDGRQDSLFPENLIETEVEVVVNREFDRTTNYGEPHYVSTIANKHEAYGHVAERIAMVEVFMKFAKDDMKEFLAKLQQQSPIAGRDTAGILYGHASEIAKAAITLAAVAKRIVSDLTPNHGDEDDDGDDLSDVMGGNGVKFESTVDEATNDEAADDENLEDNNEGDE